MLPDDESVLFTIATSTTESFDDRGGATPISTGGGTYPVWNPNGRELFYQRRRALMASSVDIGGEEVVVGRAEVLFEGSFPWGDRFSVTPDGRRFILTDYGVAEPAPTKLVLVQGFGEELERLLPR